MAIIINGKEIAASMRGNIKERAARVSEPPCLAVVLAGQNPASLVYVGGKEKACAEAGFRFKFHGLDENVSQDALLAVIKELNADASVHGILVQQPLPGHLDTHTVVSAVDPVKDVDCLHPYNAGLVMAGRGELLPCTPAGVVRLLKESGVPLEGKRCVILGRSDVVGKPLALLMLRENATVTVCHSRTENLSEICQSADILVAAIGRARFVTADMIKPGCAVVDVGINRLGGKKICGDVDYAACLDKAGYITPVPGGVGPMTIAMLLENTLTAQAMQHA